jgi:membrane associated rhomboid family serine protease
MRGGGAYGPGGGGFRLGAASIPLPIAILIGVTFFGSITAAILHHLKIPAFYYVALIPSQVFTAELWRLVTWPFFEDSPFSLLMACLMFYWFAKDLCRHWGAGRFIALLFGATLVISGTTVLLARFAWSPAFKFGYLGLWPLAEAMTISWALLFPDREIRLYFVLPVRSWTLILLTIGITALMAIYYGLTLMLPHFIAEALTLVYMGEARRLYLRWKLKRLQKEKQRYVDNVIRMDEYEKEHGRPPSKPKYLN